MAVQGEGGGKEDLKTQFGTTEGTYRLMTLSEYSRPNRVGYTNSQGSSQVRVSLVTLPASSPGTESSAKQDNDRICFNYGKELYVYVYKGVKKASDLKNPIDKRLYKGINPTCHDFNTVTPAQDYVSLVIGFSTGLIQIIDPIKKEISKLYNEERLIDKTRVTCIKWVPGSCNLFVVAHASGQLYVYNEELSCGPAAPHYQPFKQGEGYAIHTCKTKSTRNPLYRWIIGQEGCCINEFAFSPCGAHLAVVSQDGFLRVFHYDTMELIGHARSYFGGFLCVCWSPDGRYVVVGGEDDLVTIWSFHESRVVARCEGHKSWVSVVAFDPYMYSIVETEQVISTGSDEELRPGSKDLPGISYRLGSVSQDTQLCLWDITEDVLRPPKSRISALFVTNVNPPRTKCNKKGSKVCDNSTTSRSSQTSLGNKVDNSSGGSNNNNTCSESKNVSNSSKGVKVNNVTTLNITVGAKSPPASEPVTLSSVTQRLAGFSFGERKDNSHKRNFSLTSKSGNSNNDSKNSSISNSVALRVKNSVVGSNNSWSGNTSKNSWSDPMRLIGTPACPRLDECPRLEPTVCKKVAHERLTALVFREDCILIACQDGGVYTWARPGYPPADTAENSHLFERDRHFERIDMVD